ncbi:unnamed protein product [Trifolium pratense]|uniref:Uncharacterized protein n=1 Tax=Trifolium pratense TaxID=57577 RepID=A0ACB0J7A5_TRIPR|nr:unnamed protein product [Trifolium pratense]
MEPITLEIPSGEDIAESIINYARHRQVSLTVLSGFGPISSVTLAPNFPMEGLFQMTSLYGTYINADCDDVPPRFIANPPHSSFSVVFTDNDGKVFGGIVGGEVIAADVVYVNVVIVNGFDFDVVDDGSTQSDSD